MAKVTAIQRMPESRRLATLVAFAHNLEASALDDCMDLLDILITEVFSNALTFVDDESKRRRILTQLNRGEERHKLARAIFHGKRGELRQRYREAFAAQHQRALDRSGLTAIDLRALSPLKWQHINPYGTFALNMLHRLAPQSALAA